MKARIFFSLLIFLSFSIPLFSQEPEELIAQGDKLYEEMKDMATAQEALSKYREAAIKAENKFEAFWKISRILYYIGIRTESKEEKEIIFGQGLYFAKKAVALEPEKPDGHYWLGISYGFYGEARGVLKSLSFVKLIKEAMNKVIELDRGYEDGGPDRVLGRVYFKVPDFAGGSKKKSLEHLLKSKELAPNYALTRCYLADTLLSLKEQDKARQELEYVLSMESDPRWVSGVDDYKEDAKKMLQKKTCTAK